MKWAQESFPHTLETVLLLATNENDPHQRESEPSPQKENKPTTHDAHASEAGDTTKIFLCVCVYVYVTDMYIHMCVCVCFTFCRSDEAETVRDLDNVQCKYSLNQRGLKSKIKTVTILYVVVYIDIHIIIGTQEIKK